jgi:hypothetical protein
MDLDSQGPETLSGTGKFVSDPEEIIKWYPVGDAELFCSYCLAPNVSN